MLVIQGQGELLRVPGGGEIKLLISSKKKQYACDSRPRQTSTSTSQLKKRNCLNCNNFRAKANFYEYLEVVKAALDSVSPGCAGNLKDALKSVV